MKKSPSKIINFLCLQLAWLPNLSNILKINYCLNIQEKVSLKDNSSTHLSTEKNKTTKRHARSENCQTCHNKSERARATRKSKQKTLKIAAARGHATKNNAVSWTSFSFTIPAAAAAPTATVCCHFASRKFSPSKSSKFDSHTRTLRWKRVKMLEKKMKKERKKTFFSALSHDIKTRTIFQRISSEFEFLLLFVRN